MEDAVQSAVCLRCGTQIGPFFPGLKTVMQLQHLPREKHEAFLAEQEAASLLDCQEWLVHHYYKSCEKRLGYCSACGGQLITWQAKWCPHCKADWHEPPAGKHP